MLSNLTVIIPIYNGINFLFESVNILLKINKTNFYILLIDDGSTDGSYEYLKNIHDERIILLKNNENKGLIYTLNKAISITNTKYIARLDADDIILPDRLEKQVIFMENNPEVVMAGTWAVSFGDVKETTVGYATDNNTLKSQLLFYCPFIHPTIILRTAILKKNNLFYDNDYPHAEDYELWTRLQKYGKIANIPEVLVKRRIHKEQITKLKSAEMLTSTLKIYEKQLSALNIFPTQEELNIHYSVTRTHSEKITLAYLQKIDDWLTKIYKANAQHKAYPEPELINYLKEIWLKNMAGYTYFGLPFFNLFSKAILSIYKDYSYWQKIKFWIKCVLKIK